MFFILQTIFLHQKIYFVDGNEQSDDSFNSDDDFYKSPTEKQAPTAKNDKLVNLFKLSSENKAVVISKQFQF